MHVARPLAGSLTEPVECRLVGAHLIGAARVEERDQHVGEHVAGEQDATVREEDRGVAGGVRLTLDTGPRPRACRRGWPTYCRSEPLPAGSRILGVPDASWRQGCSVAVMDEAVLRAAVAALVDGPRHSIADAAEVVPNTAGLYAIYGDGEAHSQLTLGSLALPLYVGKAERSLVGRDLRTHFATGKTGSSTVRRTLAALLREALDLHAVPRNLARPDGRASYSLEVRGDQRLTEWMHAHLQLAVWARPDGVVLDQVETAVLDELQPPLNLAKMGPRGDRRVRAARAAMAAEARASREG